MAKDNATPSTNKSTGTLVRNVLIGLLVAAFVGVGAFGLLSRTSFLMDKLTAMEYGGEKISALEYRVYYKTTEINFVNQYAADLVMYYGVDLSQPLETQPYGNGTWGDYLHASTQSSIAEIYSLYLEAKENGYELVSKDDPLFQAEFAAYRAAAEAYDMELDEYVDSLYGKVVDVEDLEDAAQIRATAMKYYNDYIDNMNITVDDIQAHYDANPETYDEVDYRFFSFPYDSVTYSENNTAEDAPKSEEEAKAMTEANIAEAQAKADEFLSKVKSEKDFIELAREYCSEEDKEKYADDDATLTKGGALSNATSSALLAWCAEDGREEGDTTTVDTTMAIQVVYFIDRYLPEEPTASVRHILIQAQAAAEDAEEEEKAEAEADVAAAKAKIEEILAEYQSGEQTEEAFGALAVKYSQDAGSVINAGLIEEFVDGSMVTEFNDWCFDSSRKPGDVEIVKTTYGYHLVYYVGEGAPAWEVSARQALESEKYSAHYATIANKYTSSTEDYGLELAY